MQHVTCVSLNENVFKKKKKKILGYIQISQPIIVYLRKVILISINLYKTIL